MQKFRKPTREELSQLSKEELIDIVLSLVDKIEALENRIARLEKNSSNSSKSPSSDISKPQRNKSQREKSDRKSGGQNGHEGITRNQIDNPDEIIKLLPSSCEKCGKVLLPKKVTLGSKRQLFDIPPIVPFVTEYQSMDIICKCGHCNKGIFPEHIKAPVQLGPNICSFMGYLNTKHVMPYERLCMISSDLLNFDISEGSIENILQRIYENGKHLHDEILENIKKQSWIGADETSVRVEAKKWWLWVWQNLKGSYFTVSDNRGYKTIKEHFGENYKGRLVHDCWMAQFKTPAKGGHQPCLEHLAREFKFVEETEKSNWAKVFRKFFKGAIRDRDKIWKRSFELNDREIIISLYQNNLEKLLNKRVRKQEERRMKERLLKYKDNVFFFMRSKDMPHHNNSSEQAIRIAKIKEKVSYGFRSKNGAERFAVLLSIIETCKKQGLSIFESLRTLVLNQPLRFQWAT